MTKSLFQSFTWRMIVATAVLTVGMFFMASAQDRPMCAGKTKTGVACRNHAKENSSYCGVHSESGVYRCGFVKKDGNPCKIRVKKSGERCHHHNH